MVTATFPGWQSRLCRDKEGFSKVATMKSRIVSTWFQDTVLLDWWARGITLTVTAKRICTSLHNSGKLLRELFFCELYTFANCYTYLPLLCRCGEYSLLQTLKKEDVCMKLESYVFVKRNSAVIVYLFASLLVQNSEQVYSALPLVPTDVLCCANFPPR